ncbi:hypothetical protein MTX26_01740 [Bradyrhizobium sp. ISRA443]|uniref:hypothetical protein n=1 Tax=unclassified Bradyrhizobium TaxID=2631580 RepID=UPI002479144F|nr:MULTISPECIES: hypothetical protein [unclassified Bradyrhizobium]WGR94792.1 hypothetical protein MTX20_11780 [Bradyrhizobium sp. ISRA435]WGR99621.1 hypothetical protein MTX23_01740 [Bradyrhizobium sp. ISRA436]WGS06511.1 hypothetical protein MTX18_01740 [Bradyrhizobium sp. ISRA437]WGS13395.1 hypothetical protein MTX26_01740 [Bradyrhizobium sp. ISRA443]
MIDKTSLLRGAEKHLHPAGLHHGMVHVTHIGGRRVEVLGISRTEMGHEFGKVDALRNHIDGGQPIASTSVIKRGVGPAPINPGCRSRNHERS